MDALKAEIASKRKNLQDDSGRPTKYMRRGELEKLKEEQERQEREAKEAQKRQELQEKENAAAKLKVSSIHSDKHPRS